MTALCAPVYCPDASVIVGIQGSQFSPAPAICTGEPRKMVVPSPILLELLRPHAQADPSAVGAYPFQPPAPTYASARNPANRAPTDRVPPGVPPRPSAFFPPRRTPEPAFSANLF